MAGSRTYSQTKGKKAWIQGAVKRPGAFTKKAKAAGMSVSAYATKVLKKGSKASTRTKRQASLAKTLLKETSIYVKLETLYSGEICQLVKTCKI